MRWEDFKQYLLKTNGQKFVTFIPEVRKLVRIPNLITCAYPSIDDFSNAVMKRKTLQTLKPAHSRIIWKRLVEWNSKLCRCGFLKEQCSNQNCGELHCPNVLCSASDSTMIAFIEVPFSRRWLFVVFMILNQICNDEERPMKFEPNANLDDRFDISFDKFMRCRDPRNPCICRFFLENICYFLNDLNELPGLEKMQQHQRVMFALVSIIKYKDLKWARQEEHLSEFMELLRIYRN